MNLSTKQVQALAPDAAAATAGSRLADAKHWQELGRSPAAIWGKCQGSTLYQVRVDLGDTTVSCSCPSRKFPCKHGLGLLLLAAKHPAAVPPATPPPWVVGWLSKRESAQAKREARTNSGDETATPDDPAADKRRKAQSKRTAAARERNVAAGLETLDLWLNDLVRSGLAGLETVSRKFWDQQAARMVDAQAPGIAARVRALAAVPNATPDWPDRLLAELGRLALLSEAYRSIDALGPALADDVRSLIGWTLNEDEVVARGEAVADDWIVLSDQIDSEDRLRVRRTWLLSAETRRTALILQYATSKDGFSQNFNAGMYQRATLVYWPGACPQRALLRERSGKSRRWDRALPGVSISELLASVADAVSRQPWLDRFPCVLGGVVPLLDNDAWSVQDAAGDLLPLVPHEHWELLALGGGAPVELAGEWDGRALRPLGVSVANRYHVLPANSSSVVESAGAATTGRVGPLAALALAGTAKAASMPAGTPALDELFAGLTPAARERELLLRSAAEAIYAQAGYVARRGVALPAPAPGEQLEACSPAVAALLDELFKSNHRGLLPEAGRLLAQARLRLPDTLLPDALNISDGQQRASLRPVLGERGRWLSRFNPRWRWAALESPDNAVPANAEAIWQQGSPAERRAILGRVRSADPALARSWIEAVWRQEKAEFRAELLEVIASGLGADDEPLLEAVLDDRAATVRARAAALLASLPGSALAARMRQRADALLELEKPAPAGGLRGFVRNVLRGAGEAGVLRATLPQELPKDWQRDGVGGTAPPGFGERSWWLVQTLALVPPAHWQARWGVDASGLLRLATGSEEGAAVLEGWSRAAAQFQDGNWALAFWQDWGESRAEPGLDVHRRAERLVALLPSLPRDEAERRILRSIGRVERLHNFSAAVVGALAAPWSDAFGHAYIDAMRGNLNSRNAPSWSGSLAIAAYALPPECFEAALQLQAADNHYLNTYFVHPFLATIGLRRRLYLEIR